jgi:hypothetical protein
MKKQSQFCNRKTKGQALLPLLIIIVIVLSLGAAAIELAISNVLVDRFFQDNIDLFYTTEAALENGFLRLLRNPAYSGESLQIGSASCTITVSGGSPAVVLANCDTTRQVKKIQGEVTFAAGTMNVDNIREIE